MSAPITLADELIAISTSMQVKATKEPDKATIDAAFQVAYALAKLRARDGKRETYIKYRKNTIYEKLDLAVAKRFKDEKCSYTELDNQFKITW